jgi:hypothetical protein
LFQWLAVLQTGRGEISRTIPRSIRALAITTRKPHRLLNTGRFTGRRTHRGGFAFGVNATTKRSLENDKPITGEKQAQSGVCAGATNQTPGAVIRPPGAVREFQFHEYADLRRTVNYVGINKLPRG